MRSTLAICLGMLTGCATQLPQSQVPVPVNHALSYQEELRASQHWNILAGDAAEQIHATLRMTGNKVLFVAEPAARSEFHRAFHALLTTQLVERGLVVTGTSSNAAIVSFDAQLVAHRSDRLARRPDAAVAIGPGIQVSRDVTRQGRFLDGTAAPYSGLVPRTEIIVTTSIRDGQQFISRRTDIYYVQEPDTGLFLPHAYPPAAVLKSIRISGDAK